jgi:hypothetical protein
MKKSKRNPKAAKKRFGRVIFAMTYVVDMDDAKMIANAKDYLFEDICNAVKYEEMDQFDVIEDKTLRKKDISTIFLIEETESSSED